MLLLTVCTKIITVWCFIFLQGYFQRIFSMKTTKSAQVLSVVSCFGCIAMAIPPAFIGVIAKSTGKRISE
jgi:high affinity choline transporter 7